MCELFQGHSKCTRLWKLDTDCFALYQSVISSGLSDESTKFKPCRGVRGELADTEMLEAVCVATAASVRTMEAWQPTSDAQQTFTHTGRPVVPPELQSGPPHYLQ